MIKIDGSQLEGGGQILRMSSSLSCINNIPINVYNIRAGRSKPGLRRQHLLGLQLLTDLSNGILKGGEINSVEVEYVPKKIEGGSFHADIQTAGSVCLLVQSVLPCALFGTKPSTLSLIGGTNADMAPQIDYTIQVFQQVCTSFGISKHFEIDLKKRGFFPKGGGEISLKISPLKDFIQPIKMLEQGKIISVKGISFVSGCLPIRMAHEMADSAQKALQKFVGPEVNVSIEHYKETPATSFGNGSAIVLWATTSSGCILGGSALGKQGVRSQEVGVNAANELIDAIKSGGCVDSFAQDQVIIFMALAKGKSSIRTSPLTLHTKTAIHVAKTMTKATFSVIEDPETETVIIECEGIGASPQKLQ